MNGREDSFIDVGELAADVLRAAYYYALADGHRVIDAGQVLVAAARNDDRARTALGPQVADARKAMPRRKGPDNADVGAAPGGYAVALREARWWVIRGNARLSAKALGVRGAPDWSDTVATALDRAAGSARSARVTRLDVPHLLLGLLDPADASVAALVSRLDLDIDDVRRRVEAGGLAAEPAPFTPLIDPLRVFGATEDKPPWPVRWFPGTIARIASRRARWGGPVAACLEHEVVRQAVLIGHDRIETSAMVLAIASLDVQLALSGQRLRTAYRPHNQGGRALTDAGFDLHQAQSVAEPLIEEQSSLPVADSSARLRDTGKPGDPAWGVPADRAIDRAAEIAGERRHRDLGTSHLLAAVLEEEGMAGQMLAHLGIDHERLRQRITDQLAKS